MNRKFMWFAVFIAAMVLVYAGCNTEAEGATNNILVSFASLSADGSATATTTRLTLTFDRDIEGLSGTDIAILPDLAKGSLTQTATGVYELAVSGISTSGQVSITVARNGYMVSGNPKTAQVYYYSAPVDIAVSFNGITADGSATETTTALTLTFDKDITGLTAADINLDAGSTGAVKGVLSRTAAGVYELTVSGISASGQVSITVARNGYMVSGNPKTAQVYYYAAPVDIAVSFNGITANGSATSTTTTLTLAFDKDIAGLTAVDITLDAGSTGAAKGALSRTGMGVYELAVSGISASGQVSITVARNGYMVSGNPKTAQVYYYSAPVDIAVSFNGITANGSATENTTTLTLAFDRDITGLTAADISLDAGTTGAAKGSLTRTATGIYELTVPGVIQSGTVSLFVTKSGYDISGNPQQVSIYQYTPPDNIEFLGLFANGSLTATTTYITLQFDDYMYGLSASDITLNAGTTGAIKGSLSHTGYGAFYELGLSGITSGGTVSVSVTKSGYAISGSPKSIEVYHYIPPIAVSFDNLEADGGFWANTTKLILTFDKDIPGFTEEDIELNAGITGAVKGTLSRTGTGTYELTVSGVHTQAQVAVTVLNNKEGYDIGPWITKFVTVYPSETYIDISVFLTGPTDKKITIKGIITGNLSKSSGGSINLSVIETFYSYEWYIGGIKVASGINVTLNVDTPVFVTGVNWITVVVYEGTGVNAIPWSGEIIVNVND